MPCLFIILGLFFPRFIMLLIWLFSNAFSKAYDTTIWPLLGFIFMPFTTLAYLGAMIYNGHSVSGGWFLVVIIAVLFDLGVIGGSTSSK
mgnify:CR=1 FL=1